MLFHNSNLVNHLNAGTQETGTNLGERIFRHICLHPGGVSMRDLEAEFEEPRMLLGYILNKLCEAGKIRKLTNHYYQQIIE